MTALERVKQELGWWIEYRHILGWMVISPSATRPAGAADVELFSAFLSLAEENERLKTELQARRAAERWISVSEKPERAGWYNVCRIDDGHRSVRCWDDSAEAWFYLGDTHQVFVPNNAFTHWRPLPPAPQEESKTDGGKG